MADSSTPSDTRRSDLGLTESVAELGVEGGGSREEDEWEGVDDRGRPFGRERAIGMLTCHGKMISMFGTVDGSVHSLSGLSLPTRRDDGLATKNKISTSCESCHVDPRADHTRGSALTLPNAVKRYW